MRFTRYRHGQFIPCSSYAQALGLQNDAPARRAGFWGDPLVSGKPLILSVVGSGGKTSTIYQLAKEYAAAGKSVFVTTTTHMLIPEDRCVLTGQARDILSQIRKSGYATAGAPVSPEKITGVDPQVFQQVASQVDLTLVEADGSRNCPLKAPNAQEPVVAPGTGLILLVVGLRGLNATLEQACHRPELAGQILGKHGCGTISPEDIALLVKRGYLEKLKNLYPDTPVWLAFNQADTPDQISQAGDIIKRFEDTVQPTESHSDSVYPDGYVITCLRS